MSATYSQPFDHIPGDGDETEYAYTDFEVLINPAYLYVLYVCRLLCSVEHTLMTYKYIP